ncbi:hypothetical protein Tco_0263847, partial [Tanacetum coccineum]
MRVSYLVRLDAWSANSIPITWPWPPRTAVLHACCMTPHLFLGSHTLLGVVQHTLATALGMTAPFQQFVLSGFDTEFACLFSVTGNGAIFQ